MLTHQANSFFAFAVFHIAADDEGRLTVLNKCFRLPYTIRYSAECMGCIVCRTESQQNINKKELKVTRKLSFNVASTTSALKLDLTLPYTLVLTLDLSPSS